MDEVLNFVELMSKKEELHPDLKPYVENTKIGPMIRHPLFFELFYNPAINAMINKRYLLKKEYLEKKLEEKDYKGTLVLYERPFRIGKFCEIANNLTDDEYWDTLAWIWTDSENLWQYHFILGTLLRQRENPEKMMYEEERKLLDQFPETFRIYRGHQGKNRLGYSWTLSHYKAMWFANRFSQKRAGVVSAVVNKKDVIAFFTRRGELEIVVSPYDVQEIKNKTLFSKVSKRTRPNWMQTIFAEAKAGFVLNINSCHNWWHWEKVENNALKIAKDTPNCDQLVVQLFALLHDCKRENENHDPDHGRRAGKYVKELFQNQKLPITEQQLELLVHACDLHNDGQVSSDPTIGACWDADRLELLRVGIIPDPNLFSTQAGKNLILKG
jgi:uncharacterized protein